MKHLDHLNHSNDDDVFNGGPCPSCRLAINKETGRLKCVIFFIHSIDSIILSLMLIKVISRYKYRWCMGGNDSWRFRVRLMLLIPALLLPITIIFIALSRSQTANKTSYSYLNHATKKQNERNVEGEVILREWIFIIFHNYCPRWKVCIFWYLFYMYEHAKTFNRQYPSPRL